MTPEQRSSEAAFENGGMRMKVKKNTDTPQLRPNWKHLFLVALHVITLLLSITTHELWIAEAASRALP